MLYAIVLNWNGEKVIASCLRSLLAARGIQIKVIVVDNASSDGSPEIVKRDFPDVELIINDRNLLFACGNNVGIERGMELGGQLFLLLNNDTEVDPDFAARMAAAMERDERIGIVGPTILYYDHPERIWYGGGDFYPVLWIPRHKNIRKPVGSVTDRGEDTAYVSGCALMVRREVFEEIGLLDPFYRIYCEDVDFCLRARSKGWRCYYEPAALVWHKVSSSSGGGLTPFKMEHRLASTYQLFKRFKPFWWRIMLFPVHAAAYIVLIVSLFATGRWGLVKGALKGALRIACGE